ncbi:trace amine-associated receptor 13c-like [Archocentrus centrarchus]|uniref:trace amine-associated receptor 13c-like n=1 Tax=Archocentrus centrarchus TaxID=63155 RepID=UPI0011EA50A9|nr:trace amine-associated receptor 13c-like [Archocentrus centrarchus]
MTEQSGQTVDPADVTVLRTAITGQGAPGQFANDYVFDHPLREDEIARRLFALCQGDKSVAEFSIDFCVLAAESGCDTKPLKGAFYQALASPIKDELATRDEPTPLEDLIALAMRIDNHLWERARERGNKTRPPRSRVSLSHSPCATTSSSAVEGMPLLLEEPAGEPMQLGRAKLTPEERQRSSCSKPTLHWSKAVPLNIVLSCIPLITVVLNLLVIISVSYFRQLHTPSNILLLSLAVSDFFVGLLLMPLEIFRNTTCWVLGDLMCSVYWYLFGILTYASIVNIVLISVDRYVAICDPLHYPTRITVGRVKLIVCLCWLFSIFYIIFYAKDILIEPGRYNSCYGECVFVINNIAGMADLVLAFIIPITVIIVLYMRVFVVAVSQARAMRSHVTAVTLQPSLNQTNRSELKAARTLGVLVVVFLASYCPFYCYFLVEESVVSFSPTFLVLMFFYFNSCLNPLIYTLFYPWFRNAAKLIITLQVFKYDISEANIL